MHELHIYDLNRVLPASHTSIAKITDDGNFNVRAVERGAKLVTSSGSRVVLQMPRGNLEGINPRIMLLKEVFQLIKDAEYGKSFRLLRQHKLDINLIYDIDPA